MCYVHGLKVKVRLLCLIQDPETTSANLQNSRWTNPQIRQHFCQTPIYPYLVAEQDLRSVGGLARGSR